MQLPRTPPTKTRLIAYYNELQRRLLNLAIAIDQMVWVLMTLGHGSPDETVSAALWRMELSCKWQGRFFRPIVDFGLRWLERDHCHQAFLAEMERTQLNRIYRRSDIHG